MALPDFFSGFGTFGADIGLGIIKGVVFALFLGAAAGLGLWFNKQRKYDHIVRVYEKDGKGNLIEKFVTKGGEFIDKKTRIRLFLLKKLKIGMNPDNIPFKLNNKGQKVVNVFQGGLKNYQYMEKPDIKEKEGLSFEINKEDNTWGNNVWEKFKLPNRFDKFKQLLPYFGLIGMGIVTLIIFYLIIDKGAAMSEAAKIFQEVGEKFVQGGGTQVIPTG